MTKTAAVVAGMAAAAMWAAGVLAEDAAKPAAKPPVADRGVVGFDKMDANGDGNLTLQEYQKAMAKMARRRFAAMDADGDGTVTRMEMRKARNRQAPGMARGDGQKKQGQGEKKSVE